VASFEALLPSEQQQPLIAGVGDRVGCLREHRGDPGEEKAMNMVIAIPVLAIHAATTALVPPSAVMRRPDGGQ
jgi:hypothetical protein